MSCGKCGCIDSSCCCGDSGQTPYYTDPCFQVCQEHCDATYVCNYNPVIRVQNEWAVPDANDLITLRVPALVDILIGVVLWNPDYGSYLIVSYDKEGQTIKVRKSDDNTTPSGTTIPSCTKFILTDTSQVRLDELEEEFALLTADVEGNTANIITLLAEVVTINSQLAALGIFDGFTIGISWAGGAGGSLANISVDLNYATEIGELVFVQLSFTFDIITNTVGQINFTLPSAAEFGDQTAEGRLKLNTTIDTGHITVLSLTSNATIKKRDETAMAVAANCKFSANFFYRKQL